MLRNSKTRKKTSIELFVVAEDLVPLLGKQASEAMGLIIINYNKFESVLKLTVSETGDILTTFADVFDYGQGNLPGISPFEVDTTVDL